ncbi:Tex-like N-terminal domain-containing protein, partial [Neptunomonas phycophila]|uniref:Tex-like N-terminal domain-containing protein n=1 Tax=Neptunomonas phycophila TaxID=1572645 RepID=UPI0026E23585
AYINPDHAINHPQDALDGAQQILIEQFAEEANLKETLRQWFWQNGQLHASDIHGKASDHSKFRDY